MIAAPDSPAQLTIQAAERVGWNGDNPFSDTVPWDICPPLAPALIAWIAKIPGVTPETAYVTLVWLAFLGSTAAVYGLWRRMGAAKALAVQTALLALLAPSGVLAIWERGEIDRLLFWKLIPFVFLAIDAFRRKPGAVRISLILMALAAMLLTRSARLIAIDVVALSEWIILFALCRPWASDAARSRVLRAAGAAIFALVATLRLASIHEPGELPPMPAALVAQAAGPAVGPVSLEARLDPALGKIHGLINSGFHPRESMMWLQALGARSVIAPAHGKFEGELECVAEENGWCVFDTGSPAPPAVLVSRERFETLRPIRGLFDVEGLERYLLWAVRPEAVGYERDGRLVTVRAEPGPHDLVLVRVRARDWEDHRDSPSVFLASDPIGYAVIDLAGDDRPAAPLLFIGDGGALTGGPRAEEIQLDDADYPLILSEGVVEATAYAPPPFHPGAHLSIFGERFQPDASEVLLDGQACSISYSSPVQINIRLPDDAPPGPHELVVNSAGRSSYPYQFDVTAP